MRAIAAYPSVGIVVLNWNSPADTLKCLDSIMSMTYPAFSATILDNGSTDDSIEQISKRFPGVQILPMGANFGYAAGNNIGINLALKRGDRYVWLLNDDVTVSPDCLSELVKVALSDPRIGFLGPVVFMREEPSRILSAGGILDNGWRARHLGIGKLHANGFGPYVDVDYLSGCALLISREAIQTIGLLDESFFAYHEDVEWCYRGKRAGFRITCVFGATAWHPDTRHRDENSPLVTYYTTRNSLLFAHKYHLTTIFFLRLLPSYLRTLLSWSARPRWRHKRDQRNAMMHALIDFFRGHVGAVQRP